MYRSRSRDFAYRESRDLHYGIPAVARSTPMINDLRFMAQEPHTRSDLLPSLTATEQEGLFFFSQLVAPSQLPCTLFTNILHTSRTTSPRPGILNSILMIFVFDILA